MATIREIADQAGVSLGTVDRVLHDRGRVSPETAARIREVIKELSFTPNLFARNLSTSREYRFGVLMPEIDQDGGYWRMPWKGIQRAVENLRAYRISLVPAFFDRYQAESFLRGHQHLRDSRVDGILMAPVVPQAAQRVLDLPDSPVHVCFDTSIDHPNIKCQIGQDSSRAGALAARLMRLICPPGRTLVVLQQETEDAHISNRVRGFRQAFVGLDYRVEVRVRSHRATVEDYQAVIDGLEGQYGQLGGVMVVESTAHLLAQALAESGRRTVPIIGFDLMEEDIPWLNNHAISFLITQNPVGQGELGIQKLFSHLVLNTAIESVVRVPLNIVTQENYQDFLETI